MLERSRDWARAGPGAALANEVYHTYVASLASFVGQLSALPQTWASVERRLVAVLFPGPGSWLPLEVAHHFPALGLRRAFTDIRMTAWAAQLRVAQYRGRDRESLHIASRARELRAALQRSGEVVALVVWRDRFESGYILQLQRARHDARMAGVTVESVLAAILQRAGGPLTAQDARRCCQGFQREARRQLCPAPEAALDTVFRWRLARWPTGLCPRLLLERSRVGLAIVGRLGAPRLVATLLRANLNGWVTGRRFEAGGSCGFGRGAEDSVEHYARCPHVWQIGRARLRLQRPGTPEADARAFLGLDRDVPDDLRRRRALLVYGVYAYLNGRRFQAIRVDEAASFVWQAIKNAARGARFTERLVDAVWLPVPPAGQRGRL